MNQQFRHHDLTDYVNNFVKHKLPKTWNDPSHPTPPVRPSICPTDDRRDSGFGGCGSHGTSFIPPLSSIQNCLSLITSPLTVAAAATAQTIWTHARSSSSSSSFSQKREPWLTPPLHLSHQISSVLAFCHCLIHAHKINIIRASWSDSQGVLMRGTDNQNASKEGHWERQYRRARLKTAESGWMIGAVDDAIAEGRECDYNLRVGIHDLTLV